MKSAENDVLNGMVISDQKVSLRAQKAFLALLCNATDFLHFRTKWTFPKSSPKNQNPSDLETKERVFASLPPLPPYSMTLSPIVWP